MIRTYNTSGFLKDASYSAYFHGILKEFENSFPNLEGLHLEVTEVVAEAYDFVSKDPIKFSTDNKNCTIRLYFYRYKDAKGRYQGKPTPADVFRTVKFVLNRASEEYKSKQNSLTDSKE